MDSFAAKVLKRQYVSSVERQWYQEIVRMAGAKRHFFFIVRSSRFQSPSFGGFNPAFGPPGFPGLAGSMEPLPALEAPMPPVRMPGASNLQGLGLELEPRRLRRGTLPELSAFDSDAQDAGKTAADAALAPAGIEQVQAAVKKDLDKAEDETDKMLDKDPDNARVPQDTADAVQMYAQKRIVPTFTGGLTMRKINDLISESRQLLHKVHSKLNAMKVKPPDTGLGFMHMSRVRICQHFLSKSDCVPSRPNGSEATEQCSAIDGHSPCPRWRFPVGAVPSHHLTVRMSVRRLTTYGGASRWLKFQKRPSAAADLQGAGSSQQQLFLAWMQSMGRRQESIFQDAASKPPPPRTSADADELSEDSEDLDSLSEDSDSEGEEEPEPRQEGRPSRRSEHVHKPKDGHDFEASETDAADTPKMELQSHRGDRLGREEFLFFALLLRRRFPRWLCSMGFGRRE
eukprot:s373_g2.t1